MSRERAGAWLRWGLFALAAALIVRAVMRQWAGVSDSLATVGWSRVALATGLALVALAFNTLSWRTVMMSVGLQAPLREASGVFLVSQAGKYVPGAVWPVVAQAEFARAHGVTRARATVGSLVAMAVGVVMAAVVGAVALAVFAPGSVLRYWWVLLIAAVLAATLVPPVLTRAGPHLTGPPSARRRGCCSRRSAARMRPTASRQGRSHWLGSSASWSSSRLQELDRESTPWACFWAQL